MHPSLYAGRLGSASTGRRYAVSEQQPDPGSRGFHLVWFEKHTEPVSQTKSTQPRKYREGESEMKIYFKTYGESRTDTALKLGRLDRALKGAACGALDRADDGTPSKSEALYSLTCSDAVTDRAAKAVRRFGFRPTLGPKAKTTTTTTKKKAKPKSKKKK